MDERIVEFSNILRHHGVRVSLSENIDAIRALELLGIGDSAIFKDALQATLVKRSIDIKTFDELFDLFFSGLGASMKEWERTMMTHLGFSSKEFQKMLEEAQRLLDRLEFEFSPLARALITGDTSQVEHLIREAASRLRIVLTEERGHLATYSLMVGQLELDGILQELENFRAGALRLVADEKSRGRISRYVERLLKELSQLVLTLIRQELKKNGVTTSEGERRDYLWEKSFAYYTEDDIRKMNEVVVQIARRFKNLLTLRRRKARRGRFDVKETLRKNLQYGGVPFRIELNQRKREKPQVVVLCDISDSVLNASRFMLQFVYSLQDLYSKVRSFVFVSDIGEVTQIFKENGILKAIDLALKGEVINVHSHSNFGRAFEVFYRDYQSAVNGKTTFLILGDGRNNYNRANEWVLKEIQQKAKQLIWLNPESRFTWGYGDSEMSRYVPYCDVVEECRNVSQLYKVIDRILV
jgi:uncharacterized protein with von Willebrand factor type A (vWA) domain